MDVLTVTSECLCVDKCVCLPLCDVSVSYGVPHTNQSGLCVVYTEQSGELVYVHSVFVVWFVCGVCTVVCVCMFVVWFVCGSMYTHSTHKWFGVLCIVMFLVVVPIVLSLFHCMLSYFTGLPVSC